jgi:hypothetical protein
MVIVCCATHAILAAVASAGPTPDIDQLDGVMDQLPGSQTLVHMVADAGFDSAHNHQLLRDQHGIRSTIPPENGRPTKDSKRLPSDPYRRLMKTRFNVKTYRKRSQIEICHPYCLHCHTFDESCGQGLGRVRSAA